MEIIFKRRLTNELMTTFLPSFFLLGICYATTYFKAFYFEANVTVNLTVMLVNTRSVLTSSRYSATHLECDRGDDRIVATWQNQEWFQCIKTD